jgi:hypothetical protein
MPVANPVKPFEHGYAAYSRGLCKCDVCRAGKATRQREMRAAAKARREAVKGPYVVEGITHGLSGYQNHKCQCGDCKSAVSEAQRRQYRAKHGEPKPRVRKACSDEGCARKAYARGLCRKHYDRARRQANKPLPLRSYESREGVCTMDGCDEAICARRLCRRHYEASRKAVAA